MLLWRLAYDSDYYTSIQIDNYCGNVYIDRCGPSPGLEFNKLIGSGLGKWFTHIPGLLRGENTMSSLSEMRKQLADLEAKIEAASKLPDSADELTAGDRFENEDGDGRILAVDGANFRLVTEKRGKVLPKIFSSKEEVLEHMEENSYSRRA